MLLGSSVLVGGSQLVSAGALLLAMVAPRDKRAVSIALAIAAAATSVRIFAGGLPIFSSLTAVLAIGFALAAWAAHRLDAGHAAWEALALRGGLVLVALAYAGFLVATFATGGPIVARSFDFGARIVAALAIAAFLEAPPAKIARRLAAMEPAAAR